MNVRLLRKPVQLPIAVIFQASVYCLLAWSSIMLALAEGAAFPALITLLICAVSFVITERKQWFHLPVLAANLLGLAALSAALYEVTESQDMEGRLLGGSHLIVYLTWIVPFEKKRHRQYWWMCALSVLQVAIGAVLTLNLSFGALLVVYLFLAVWTMSVFSLHLAQLQIQRLGRVDALEDAGREAEAPSRGDAARPSLAGHSTSVTRGRHARVLGADGSRDTGTPSRIVEQWGIAGSSAAYSVVQRDRHDSWIGPRFLGGTLVSTVIAMTISVILFLVIPRFWLGDLPLAADFSSGLGQIVSGFSAQVQLGSFGRIQESSKRAFSVQLFDTEDGSPIDVVAYTEGQGYVEPLFRGVVMSDYEQGRWRPDWRSSGRRGDGIVHMSDRYLPPAERSVRQVYRFDTRPLEFLFCLQPLVAPPESAQPLRVAMNRRTMSLVWLRPGRREQNVRYTVFSAAPRPYSGKRPSVPDISPWKEEIAGRYLSLPDRPQTRLRRLEELAAKITGYGKSPKSTSPIKRAEMLERYLQTSGEFGYTLDQTVIDPQLDPVEDFLFNRKEGHCEYFATALTLMCRAVGVPARLVTGYKGGRRNEVSQTFDVDERNAHAWVEVFDGENWLVFDATPGAVDAADAEGADGQLPFWESLRLYLYDLWIAYVVTLTLEQQQAELYEPVQAAADDIWQSLEAGSASSGDRIREFSDYLRDPEQWFSWRGGVVTFILLAVLVQAGWAGRRLWRWLHGDRSNAAGDGRTSSLQVAFYERFQDLCARQGLVRRPGQTPREFAQEVIESWSQALGPDGAADVPRDVVDAFYDIRFGGATLPPQVVRRLESALAAIETRFNNPSQSPAADFESQREPVSPAPTTAT